MTINFSAPLPVQIVDFTAVLEGQDVALSWNTANENNMKEYVIEKSYNNKNWTILKTLHSNTQQQSNTYSAKDSEGKGLMYYRLITVDINDSRELVKTVNIDLNNGLDIRIFPNPASNNITLKKNATDAYVLYLYNMNGQLIKQINWGNNNVMNINITDLKKGAYILKINDHTGKSVTVKKLLKN